MNKQNKYRVVVSEQAAQMLFSHAAFFAQVNPDAAERLTAAFEKSANSLEIMPQRCPWLVGEYIPKNAYRFILFEKWYMLVFQVIDDTVYIDYTIDCRQDYGWLIH
ncbi:MAG: type II toxin-antitoxin system RelE/ParE family toxin [Oscillospiraceae bacterium]|nr:type II toxin-antitoxin system RelE/ParE family toxin [Oscillospiraceae bacterium]